jgi:hypothetical protein
MSQAEGDLPYQEGESMNTTPNQSIMMGALSILFLTLAITYCMVDYAITFKMDDYSTEWQSPSKFALQYVVAYYLILSKSIIILLFVFVFIAIYAIMLVGFVGPILSENITSKKNISSFAGVDDIISASKNGYFASIRAVVDNVSKVIFGFVSINYCVLLLLYVVPAFIFSMSYAYYVFLSRKDEIDSTKLQRVLKTNFHYISIFIICLVVIAIMYLIVLTIFGKNEIKFEMKSIKDMV